MSFFHFPALRTLVFFLTMLTVLCGGSMTRAADNTNIAHVRPEVVIPFMKASPKIDGVISDGEWSTLHVNRFVSQNGDLLSNRPGEFWLGCDRTKLYIAVRSGVHPQSGAMAKFEPRGNADIGDAIYDDSLELWIDNNPGGATGQYFQIMVNSRGALYDASFDHHDKIAQKYWRVNMEQAHRVENSLWTAEFAIPLSELGIADPTQALGMRIARNFKAPWDQARWEPLVRAFESTETMGQVRFSDVAPIVNELSVQDADGINIGVEVSNPTTKPLPLKIKIGYNAQDQPRYSQDWTPTLAPGESQKFEYKKPLFTPDNYPAIGEILVTSDADTVLYHRDFKWQTRPKSEWDVVASTNPTEATQFQIAWLPSYHVLRWKTSFENLKGREDVKTARLVIARDGAAPMSQTELLIKKFAGEGQISLPQLPDGKYQVQLFLDGIAPATTPARVLSFQQQNDFVWKNNTIGLSDQIIPPFTPITVKARTVGTLGRAHGMTTTGLWSQVLSQNQKILASPMQLVARQKGKVQTATGKLAFVEKKPNRVVTRAEWQAGTLRGRTTSEWDYDGMMKVTLDLFGSEKHPIPLDGVDILIPLRDEMAPLMHACGEGLRVNYGGVVPAGEGEVWNSNKASRDKLIGSFLPYLFVGGEERGLVWFASNDRDWVTDDSGKNPALSLERHNGVLTLRIRLVQQPTSLVKTHRIVFGLQATPVKPMPSTPDWRTWGVDAGAPYNTQVLGMSMYWGSDLYGIFPRNRDFTIIEKIAEAEKQGQSDRAFFDEYVKANPDIKAEINNAANPNKVKAIIPYTNLRGDIMTTPEWRVYQDEWRRTDLSDWRSDETSTGSIDFSLTPVKSRQDYLVWYYREILRHGFDGIYWDNICIYDNENPVTGNGYLRDDGSYQTDTDIWQLRALTKRTATMLYQMGKPNLTMPHMTNAYLIPVFSWTTMNLDWEWKYGGTDFQDRFTRDYIRAASLGRQGGNVPIVLPGITEVTDPEKQKWVERTRIGVTIPHELTIWHADALFAQLHGYLYSLGYGTPAVTTYHYWDAQPVAAVKGLDAAWIAFENKDTVALFLSDYGDGGAAQITLDVKRLGLPANFVASNWENPQERYSAQNGILTLSPIKKHDFRLLIIPKTPSK